MGSFRAGLELKVVKGLNTIKFFHEGEESSLTAATGWFNVGWNEMRGVLLKLAFTVDVPCLHGIIILKNQPKL